jgi:dTDP-4-amino-4,6-dideoxygalactose transaminase
MIPFLDLKQQTDEIREELDTAYRRFMDSGMYVLGQEVDSFEKEYAFFCESTFCVGVGNGLDALHLALRALDVGPGDEVIVPSNTYIATWLAVTQVGATIVPVEPDVRTFNIDPSSIAAAVTKNTKVIMPVNLYGQPADYDPIIAIARECGAKVVVDNAQAQGARYKGRCVGGLADIECHSFYPSKNLGVYGEAGAITTNDSTIADRIRLLRNYGSRVRYYNEECGYNSRLDALQAAFLRVKLRHLDNWNMRRKQIAKTYLAEFSTVASSYPQLLLPFVPEWADPVWHLFVVKHSKRDELQRRLTDKGIGTLIHYPVAIHRSKAYADYSQYNLPIAEQLANSVLSIPLGPQLVDEDVRLVASTLLEVLPCLA